MSSSSAPVSSLSEGRVSFRFWDFEIASTPNPSEIGPSSLAAS